MQVDYIINQVNALIKRTGTRNPKDICKFLDYKLRFMDLQHKLNGYFIVINRITNIVIDDNVIDIFQPVLIAHELGHAFLHKELATMSGFQELEFFEKRETAPMEYEANLFAAELLLEDEQVLELLNEYTFFETASILNVPASLLDFKFILLQAKGYRIRPVEISKSTFLKENNGAYGTHD